MQLMLTFAVLLSVPNVISGTFLQKCKETITINNAYNEIHLSGNGGDHYKDGEKIKCDVWFVSGVPNTTISVKFPSYDIAIDGNTQSDWPSSALSVGIPGAPHARGGDGIVVYDMVAKKYMLGDSETRWAGTKGTRWDFAGSDVQQKEYQYYNLYLGKMKDVETVKKFTKPAKVYVSYKGEPRKDSFTMEIGLVGLPTTTPPPTTTTTTISTTPLPTTTRKTTTVKIIDLAGHVGKKEPDDDSNGEHHTDDDTNGDDDPAGFFPYAIAAIVVVVVAVLGIGLRCYIIRRRAGRMLGFRRSDQAGLLT
ncbi:unnamed protein product [Owenia fusiformis]|uniref:Uncharacterized protein n=1 Tax=Owenia fusiformis TaxID=6347 RepID=A0A8J1U352_OWEFU|nr:unnamed protein product [Owenia fusiformis]